MDLSAGNKRAAVIVLHWNKLEFTLPCYESLIRMNGADDLRIIIVDNGSTAHSPAELTSRCPLAEVIRLDKNYGFAGGMNRGIEAALDGGAEIVWLLNNDTLCSATALADILGVFASDRKIGAVASKLVQASKCGGEDGEIIRSAMRIKAPFYIPQPVHGEEFPPQDEAYLCGASLAVRADVIREIGMLDEGFPFFFEDADWSFRVKKAGLLLAETARASVTHTGSASIGTLGEKQAEFYRRGHLRFLKKHAGHPRMRALLPFAWRVFVCLAHFNFPAVKGNIKGFI